MLNIREEPAKAFGGSLRADGCAQVPLLATFEAGRVATRHSHHPGAAAGVLVLLVQLDIGVDPTPAAVRLLRGLV
jgi:hypothetical protein